MKMKISRSECLNGKISKSSPCIKLLLINEMNNSLTSLIKFISRYKMMHDNLTSEIKLLTGKLNSMEEFRLQRDDLMAKFDTQEIELKDQAKKHKAILYEMERKVILDKERMRKDVENKLLELSNEFTKTSDSRIAASTQRLLRENIALNNDTDRILVMQARLQKENEEMSKKHKDIVSQYEANVIEKKRLMKTCEQQLEIIKKLTQESENSRDLNNYLIDIKRSHEVARRMTRDNKNELMELNEKIHELKDINHTMDFDRQVLKKDLKFYRNEYEGASNIIETIRLTVKSAINGEKEDRYKHDPAFYEARRSNLLADLLNILNNIDSKEPIESGNNSSFYSHGDLGLLPKTETEESVLTKYTITSLTSTTVHSVKSEIQFETIIDPASAPFSFASARDDESLFVGSDENFKVQDEVAPQKSDISRKSTVLLSIDLRQASIEQQQQQVDDDGNDKNEEGTADQNGIEIIEEGLEEEILDDTEEEILDDDVVDETEDEK